MNVPRISNLLEDIATSTPEREDVARWLLGFGAKMHQRLPWRVPEPTPDHPRSDLESDCHNASLLLTILQKAAESGNRKIVRLLLERGADPASAQLVTFEHSAKYGSLSIPRMLVEYGASIPRDYEFTTLLRHAFNVENQGLYRFLLARGGRVVSRMVRLPHAIEDADSSYKEAQCQVTSSHT